MIATGCCAGGDLIEAENHIMCVMIVTQLKSTCVRTSGSQCLTSPDNVPPRIITADRRGSYVDRWRAPVRRGIVVESIVGEQLTTSVLLLVQRIRT